MSVVNASDTKTAITYEEARETANELKQCASAMKTIFSEFENTMKLTGTEDVFFGEASDKATTKFDILKGEFDTFVNTVNLFSETLNKATDAEERTERAIEQDTEDLF